MVEPVIDNRTPFALAELHLADEIGQPVFTPLIRATYRINASKGKLELAEEQVSAKTAGEFVSDDEPSSYRYEPETAFVKVATDVVLIGHARAPKVGAQVADVGFKVGPLQKIVRVFGDRYWVKTGGSILATRPQAFERIPLVYERAYGGWDKADRDERQWRCDLRNPVGRGFGDPLRLVEEGKIAMPNLEDPNRPIKRYGDAPVPAGFGFISAHWQHRAQFAGTYDEIWENQRKPLLPADFDRRFFNAASPGLTASGYFRGDEDVVVVNASPMPQLRFRLPGVVAPRVTLGLHREPTRILQTNLDTVIVNTDEMLVFLLWRTFSRVPNGPHDIATIDVAIDGTRQSVGT